MTRRPSTQDQLGFDALFVEAEADIAARAFAKETAHLPDTWPEAVACHRRQIDAHHAAMLANEFEAAMTIRKDAHLLAKKLNGGQPGILANDDAPGCRLERKCKASAGMAPLWGQSGTFAIEAAGMAISVEMESVFGIGAILMPFLGFSVRCVDVDQPFLSETGYRSFLGCTLNPWPEITPDAFAERVVTAYVEQKRGERLVSVADRFRT